MRLSFVWMAPLLFGMAQGLVACSDDGAAETPPSTIKKPRPGGQGGEDTGDAGSGGSDSGGSGGSAQGGSTTAGQGGTSGGGSLDCVKSPPPLPACDNTTGCLACICDKCADAWDECMADAGCKKAVSCVAAGCSISQCASLTSGEASLAKAEAIDECRARKTACRSECTTTGSGGTGSGGSAQAGAGGSGEAGAGGSGEAGAGGSPIEPVDSPQCCQISDGSGCSGLPEDQQSEDQKKVQACVCASDAFCCNNMWDETCVADVATYGCAPACPPVDVTGGAGGSGGSGQGGEAGAGAGGSPGGAGGAGGSPNVDCAPLVFPSITLQTRPDPELTALYEALGQSTCEVPTCFLDVSDLRDGNGTPVSVKVNVSAKFTLYELIATEIDPKKTGNYDPANAYSSRVLIAPDFVVKLQKLREYYNAPVNLITAYHSPQHQKQLCQSLCGADECKDPQGNITCVRNSGHLWGGAADMDKKYEGDAKKAGFPHVVVKNGTVPYLHVDALSCAGPSSD